MVMKGVYFLLYYMEKSKVSVRCQIMNKLQIEIKYQTLPTLGVFEKSLKKNAFKQIWRVFLIRADKIPSRRRKGCHKMSPGCVLKIHKRTKIWLRVFILCINSQLGCIPFYGRSFYLKKLCFQSCMQYVVTSCTTISILEYLEYC